MSQSEQPNPGLTTFSILVVVLAVGGKIVQKFDAILNGIEAFLIALWPIVLWLSVTAAGIFLSRQLVLYLIRKWKAHQKFIEDLQQTIDSDGRTIEAKEAMIDQHERTIAALKNRRLRLKQGLARYHRLLVRQIPAGDARPEKMKQKAHAAMRNVLADFGASPSSNGKGGFT